MRHPLRFALLSALAVAGVAALAPATALAADKTPTRGLRFPSLTPDGKTVVFAWRGDIWRAPVAGGTATRLTIHEAQDTKPRVSPDGKWIAFSSKRTGNYDVFLMPIEGGEPKQVTTHSGTDIVTDWSPDGKRLLLLTTRDPGPYGTDVYEIDVEGGTPRRITRDGGRDGVLRARRQDDRLRARLQHRLPGRLPRHGQLRPLGDRRRPGPPRAA